PAPSFNRPTTCGKLFFGFWKKSLSARTNFSASASDAIPLPESSSFSSLFTLCAGEASPSIRGVQAALGTDVQTGLTIHPADAWPVTQQSTGNCELTHEIYGWQGVPLGEGDDLFAAIKKDRIC